MATTTTNTYYSLRCGSCYDGHLTAARVLHHLGSADALEEIEVTREDGAPCRVEADLDDECLALYCGDELVARGERESAEVIDRWL